jgi:NADPH2:quinone reductase
MLQRVANDDLHVEIDRSFPLEDAAAAHEHAESRKAFGRIIITP